MEVICIICDSSYVVKNGRATRGYQQFKCNDCGKTFVMGGKFRRLSERERREIVRLYYEGAGIREIARRYNISPATVMYWIKKIQ